MQKKQAFQNLLAVIVKGQRENGCQQMTTVQVIRLLKGQFLSDYETPVHRSWNAGVGRTLSVLSEDLGIHRSGDVRLKDDAGNRTRSAVWDL